MTDIEGQIVAEIDRVLTELDEAESAEREARRVHDKASARTSALDGEARRLRLALYQIRGEAGGAGDANVENLKRRSQLSRGTT